MSTGRRPEMRVRLALILALALAISLFPPSILPTAAHTRTTPGPSAWFRSTGADHSGHGPLLDPLLQRKASADPWGSNFFEYHLETSDSAFVSWPYVAVHYRYVNDDGSWHPAMTDWQCCFGQPFGVEQLPQDNTAEVTGSPIHVALQAWQVAGHSGAEASQKVALLWDACSIATCGLAWAPTNLRVVDKSQSSVRLAWDDNSSDESSFSIERRAPTQSNPDPAWSSITSVGANVTTYMNEGLKHSTTYEYRVRANAAIGPSGWSNTVSATTSSISADQLSSTCTDTPYSISPDGCQGDPVKSGIGAFVTSISDLKLPGFGIPLDFQRFYSSADTTDGVLGVGWTHSFAVWLNIQADGDVVFRTGNGQRLLFVKRANGTFASDSGIYGTLSQEGSGYAYARRDQTSYRFDSNGRLLSQLDRNGNGLSFTYNIDGKLTVVTDAAGRALTLSHNVDGRVSAASLSDGRQVTYSYDASGRLGSVTDVRGGTTTYTYDASGRLKKITDQGGHVVVDNTYDSNGRVVEQLDGEGSLTTFSWDASTQTATMTDSRGKQWKDIYSGNELIQRIDPLSNTIHFERDNRLNITKLTDARGGAWAMSYDNRGNMLTRTAPAPLSFVEEFTYDDMNNLLAYEDGRGNTTTYDYDDDGNLTSISEAGGSVVTEFVRDPGTGLVTSVTDPRDKTTSFDYDDDGNLIEVVKPSGAKTTFTYDASGRMTSMIDPRGHGTGALPTDFDWIYGYDPANHLVALTDPLGNQTEWTYALDGTLTSVEDAKGRTTTYGYDNNHRLVTVTAPDTSITSHDYDAVGNLVSRTDANSHTTNYAYDDANRLDELTLPGGHTWTYAHDANGNLTEMVDAIGNATTSDPADGKTIYTHDELDRLTGIDYSGTTPDVTYDYDVNGNLTEIVDAIGTKSYVYDALDRLIEVTRGTQSFAYDYDLGSNLTERTYPDGTIVTSTYDDDSRLAAVSSGGQTTSYGYDLASNLITTTLPASNGHTETRTYDRAGRLSEVLNARGPATLSRFTYARDEIGNPASVATLDGTTTYVYDDLDRLTKVCFPLGCPGGVLPDTDSIAYTYDAVGNRLTETTPSAITSYTYDAADRLTSSLSGSTTTNYSHDANGNMTAAAAKTYAYDQANRMTSATVSGATSTYEYDGSGIRTRATQGTNVTDFTWDENAGLRLLARESDGAGALMRRYIYGRDLVSSTTPSTESYFHHDGIGSVTNVTNATGVPQWSYTYEPFGSARTATKVVPLAPHNPMRFTGEHLDSTGLYHLRARQMDPSLGRFTKIDPYAPSILNPYVSSYLYANSRPTFFIDPSGLTVQQALDLMLADVTFGLGPPNPACGMYRCPPSIPELVHSYNVAGCVIACLSVSWADQGGWSLSIGAFNVGRGSGWRRGIGAAIYVTEGDRAPDTALSGMACKIACLGGYVNADEGSGTMIGVGSPGLFVGGQFSL